MTFRVLDNPLFLLSSLFHEISDSSNIRFIFFKYFLFIYLFLTGLSCGHTGSLIFLADKESLFGGCRI